jgi:hypothetical protein
MAAMFFVMVGTSKIPPEFGQAALEGLRVERQEVSDGMFSHVGEGGSGGRSRSQERVIGLLVIGLLVIGLLGGGKSPEAVGDFVLHLCLLDFVSLDRSDRSDRSDPRTVGSTEGDEIQ